MSEPLTRWKSYVYPGTDVLINKAGFEEAEQLEVFEYRVAAARQATMPASVRYGDFDLKHLQAIHRHLFQDVYAWAGQLRDVGMSKGKSLSFEKPENFQVISDTVHERLKQANYFQGRDRKGFVEGLSAFYADMNRLHPFREGNGRATRVLLSALAERAGYVLDQRRIENDLGQWNKAAASAMTSDMTELKKIFMEAVRPSRAVALEQMSPERALLLHPELKPVYATLTAQASTLAAQHPGNERAQAHFLAAKRSEMVRQLDSGDTRALDMAAARRGPLGRVEYTMLKAFEHAEKNFADPKARADFIAGFQERIKAVEKPPMSLKMGTPEVSR